jgi:hypothetical protein
MRFQTAITSLTGAQSDQEAIPLDIGSLELPLSEVSSLAAELISTADGLV